VTDWITQRAREIVDNLTQGDTYLDRFKKAELVGEIVAITAEAYARGCVDQHERTKAEAVKVAQSMAALTSDHAAYTIAAAIEKMERPV